MTCPTKSLTRDQRTTKILVCCVCVKIGMGAREMLPLEVGGGGYPLMTDGSVEEKATNLTWAKL